MTTPAMSWRDHIRQNMRLAAPLMIGQLATIGIWTSNTIAMGRIDCASLAAGALAGFTLGLGPSSVLGGLLLGLSVAAVLLTI